MPILTHSFLILYIYFYFYSHTISFISYTTLIYVLFNSSINQIIIYTLILCLSLFNSSILTYFLFLFFWTLFSIEILFIYPYPTLIYLVFFYSYITLFSYFELYLHIIYLFYSTSSFIIFLYIRQDFMNLLLSYCYNCIDLNCITFKLLGL